MYIKTIEEHLKHLQIVFHALRNERLFAKNYK